MVLRLWKFVESFYSLVRNIFPHIHFFACPFMSKDQEDMISASGFHEALERSLSLAPAEILASNISLWVNLIAHRTFFFEYNPNTCGRGMKLSSSRSTSFIRFQIGLIFSVLPAILIFSTYTDKNSPFVRLTNQHSQFTNFPPTVLQKNSQIASLTVATVQIPFEKNDWIFHTGPWFGPLVLW